MLRLLALSGKRFSGKDTLAARRLASHAFAGESKRMFAARNAEVDLERLTTDRAYKERWRPSLTAFTVEALAADPLVFARAVAARIDATGAPALISDLRLRRELDFLRPRYALHVARLHRGDEQRAASGWRFTPEVDGHHTETELDDPALWDSVVPNDGELDALRAQAASLVATHVLAA
jgi:phosphomevalonate kinase